MPSRPASSTSLACSAVLENIGQQDPRRFDYGTAGNLVRWLLETQDPSLIRPILEGSSVDSVHGRSVEELAQAYDAEHPYAYHGFAF